jgi:hypothetical protein
MILNALAHHVLMTPVLASPTTRHTNSLGTAPRKIHRILKFAKQDCFFHVTDRASWELGTALFDYHDPNVDEPDPEDEHAEGTSVGYGNHYICTQ